MKKWLLMAVLFGSNAWANAPALMSDVDIEQTQKELDKILMSSEYSDITSRTEWVANQVPNEHHASADLTWLEKLLDTLAKLGELSQVVGVFGKILAIVFLLVMVGLLIKYKDVWLPWFRHLMVSRKSTHAVIYQNNTPTAHTWQQLPDKNQLPDRLKWLLAQGRWLETLSLLYQATLREFGTQHGLPVDKYQTEEQCIWLLHQAKHKHPNEQAYFDELVRLWRASAYGQRLPDGVLSGDYSVIVRLINAWGVIYLGGERG